MRTSYRLFLASPLETALCFLRLLPTPEFWRAAASSLGHILCGFLLALLSGSVLAAASAAFPLLDDFLQPVMRLSRTVPVVSFIILALLMLSSRYLSIFISFLMCLPVLYMTLAQALSQRRKDLEEMAQVFHVPAGRKLRYMILPQIWPAFENACVLSISLAWKSGTAAEVLGMTAGSIGGRLQQAKVYLDTPALFAWTAAVVLLSVLTEKGLQALLRLLYRRMQVMK